MLEARFYRDNQSQESLDLQDSSNSSHLNNNLPASQLLGFPQQKHQEQEQLQLQPEDNSEEMQDGDDEAVPETDRVTLKARWAFAYAYCEQEQVRIA